MTSLSIVGVITYWALLVVLCQADEPSNQETNPKPTNVTSDADALQFLTRYGYLSSDQSKTLAEHGLALSGHESFRDALLKAQNFAGLPETGKLDDATLELMNKPRCGMPDFHESYTKGIDGKYTLLGTKWPSTYVSYRITRFTNDLSIPVQDATFYKAAGLWDAASSALYIYNTCVGSIGDIEIGFYTRDHGDGFPFDGPSGVLAHAYQPAGGYSWPAIYGDMHLDDDEKWTSLDCTGTDLLQVATHEFGHSLGLGHSSVAAAAMWPYYTGYNSNFALDNDDINGIRALYGA